MLYKQHCFAIHFLSPVHATHSVRTQPERQHMGRSSALRATAFLPAASKAQPPARPRASPQHGRGPAPGGSPAPAGV